VQKQAIVVISGSFFCDTRGTHGRRLSSGDTRVFRFDLIIC
jgi:hypothetical protein